MNLDTLKQFDPITVNGILAAAAFASAPDPGVGERPLVLRTYEKEAADVLSEIRDQLKISNESDPVEARDSISRALDAVLRQSVMRNIDIADVLKRLGDAGDLPLTVYNVVQPNDVTAMLSGLGIRASHVEDAVKHPDDHQHLMAEGMPTGSEDVSLFMKRVMSREAQRRHWLLVQCHRVGMNQRVGAAWQIYPDDLRLERARKPIDVLKAFVDVYGVPIKVGEQKGLFIESQTYPPGTQVSVDWTGAPREHFVSSVRSVTAGGTVRVGASYCIDIGKYREALSAHGVKVRETGPNLHRSVTETTTQHPDHSFAGAVG